MSRARELPPEPGAIRPFEFPDVVRQRLDGGLDLRVARLPRLPLVTLSLVLPAGEVALAPALGGLAVLTGDALEGGTATRSGAALAEAVEDIGAGLEISTGWDATTVSLSCLADRMDEALGLLAEVALRPAFPEDEVERMRGQRLAVIRQRAMDPSALAGDQAVRLIYREGSRYGRPLGGTLESVEAIDRAAVEAFHAERYRPAGAGVVMAGDVDPDDAAALLRRHFGAWEGASPATAPVEGVARATRRTVHVVDRPGAVQSELRLGHPGVPHADPDHVALVVLNTVLGGAFTSRLNLSLRERHGFTYGVRSRFSFRGGPGPFHVSTAVGSEATAPAVREIMGELEAIVDDGPTDAEVEAARDYVAGVFPLRLETTAQVASRIAEQIVYGLADDYHATYRERIRAVDREAALAAARRHIRPAEATIVVVGDAGVVREPLESLSLGPVEVHG
ncbi:MAG: insulinase family protein [Gemmatimonadetes bacterium]|nr:insulinase family protein [Gemmatimonadota bacterium]